MPKDNRTILRGVVHGAETFLPGQEDELEAAATPAELERLKSKGAIDGDWKAAKPTKAEPVDDAKTKAKK